MAALVPYHSGMVVEDVAAAAADLERRIGYKFNAPITVSIPRFEDRTIGHDAPLTIAATYSRTGPFRLELIEAQCDGVYSSDRGGLHHLGVWEPDMTTRLRTLEECDAIIDAVMWRADGGLSAIYARIAGGTRIEYVNSDRRVALERWFDTGVLG